MRPVRVIKVGLVVLSIRCEDMRYMVVGISVELISK